MTENPWLSKNILPEGDNKFDKIDDKTIKNEYKSSADKDVESTRTTYDDNPLLSIKKPTSVPNNTPVESPGSSPDISNATHSKDTKSSNNYTTVKKGSSFMSGNHGNTNTSPKSTITVQHYNGGCVPPNENLSGKNKDFLETQNNFEKKIDTANGDERKRNKSQNTKTDVSKEVNDDDGKDSSREDDKMLVNDVVGEFKKDNASSKAKSKEEDEDSRGSNSSRSTGDQSNKILAIKSSQGFAPDKFIIDNSKSINNSSINTQDNKIHIGPWPGAEKSDEIYSVINTTGYREDTSSRESDDHIPSISNKNNNGFEVSGNILTSQQNTSALSMSSSSSLRSSRQDYSHIGIHVVPQTSTQLSKKKDTKKVVANKNELPPINLIKDSIAESTSTPETGSPETLAPLEALSGMKRKKSKIILIESRRDEKDYYFPPPPPKYINSKLDEVRFRLLNNPRPATASSVPSSSKVDEDMGSAAAVLSNMRSSPFKLPNGKRPTSNTESLANAVSNQPGTNYPNNNQSTSSTSLFPGKLHQRPIIKIQNRPRVFNDDEDPHSGSSEGSMTSKTSNSTEFEMPVSKGVTWNKSGKRVNSKEVAVEAPSKKRKKRNTAEQKLAKLPPSNPPSPTSNKSELNSESTTFSKVKKNSSSNTTNASNENKKNLSGNRSRNGCWICRLRKKKCSEEKPNCSNCDRLNLECHYHLQKPDFVSDPIKKQLKLEEIKKKTKEAKRNAMRKKPFSQTT